MQSVQVRYFSEKKLFVLYSYSILITNIYIVKIFFVLHNKVSLLNKRCSERGTRIRHQRNFKKVLPSNHILENIDQKINFYDPDETEIRFPLQIFLNIFECIWWSLHSSFLFMVIGKRWRKVILCLEIR